MSVCMYGPSCVCLYACMRMWLRAACMWSKNLSHVLMSVWWGGDGQRLVVGGERQELNSVLRKKTKVEAIASKILKA